MKRLLNLFQDSSKSPAQSPPKVRRYSVGTWKHAADNKQKHLQEKSAADRKQKQPKEVINLPPLEMEKSLRKWGDKQFAVSTVKATTEERPKGSRQVKAPARLGHYTSGKKGIDTSVCATTIPKLEDHNDDGDDDDESDNHGKMCAGHIPPDQRRSHLIPGRYSLIRPGDVEEPQNQLSSTTNDAPLQELDVTKKKTHRKVIF
jgi:hypothetical protein